MMEIEKLIKHMREEAQDYRSGRTLGRAFADAEDVLDEAATALEQLQTENDMLKEMVSFYCDMCIEQDGVLWCQGRDEKCDYCIYPKEE